MNKLQKIIKEIFDNEKDSFIFSYSFEEFKKDFENQKKESKKYIFLNQYFRNKLKPEKEYLDFLVTKNSQLVSSLHHYFDNSEKAKIDYDKKTYTYKVLNDFWKIFIVISNNYKTLKYLYLNGMDYQAKIIFRNTIELTELCISILGNEEFYSFFKKQNNTDNPELIFQTIKFGTTKKTTNKVISHIKEFPNNNVPKELWNHYIQIRQEYYEDSSRHVHSNYLNIMLGSYVPVMKTKFLENDMMLMNLGGHINDKTKSNIKDIIIYDSISYLILLILIIDKHKLYFAKIDTKKEFLIMLSKFNWDLLSSILSKK